MRKKTIKEIFENLIQKKLNTTTCAKFNKKAKQKIRKKLVNF